MTTPTETACELPIIDVSVLSTGGDAVEAVAAEILEATRRSGFFYVRNHGIDQQLIDAAVSASAGFFARALDDKRDVSVNQRNRGFMEIGECRLGEARHHCMKEVFFFGPEHGAQTGDDLPLMGDNQWPVFMPGLREAVWPYYRAVMSCGGRLLSAVAIALGLKKDFFRGYYRQSLGRAQLLHYPPLPADAFEDQFSAAPHTDFGCITLLWQDNNGGLEVRLPDDRWIAAPPVPGTLVINVGDLLARWSNDRMRSTLHRVRNLAGRRRYSMAVFFDPDSDALIDPRDMGVSGHEALYPAVTAGEYIMSKNRGTFGHYQRAAGAGAGA